MGLAHVAPTQTGVLAFISGEFASAAFAVASDAGAAHFSPPKMRFFCISQRDAQPPSDSNSTVIAGQFVALGSALLKFSRAVSDCETLDNFVAICGPERVASEHISWRQIRCTVLRCAARRSHTLTRGHTA
jgi:hypothetical protein